MLSQLIDRHILSSNNTKYETLQSHSHQAQNNPSNPLFNTIDYPVPSNPLPDYSQNHQQTPFIQRSSSRISQSIPGNHVCSQCSKTFYKNAHLVRHISQKHSDNRSFLCSQPTCGKTFKRDSHLRRHMISHTHQKRFKCTVCIMAFGYKHHLDRHVKTVHERQLLTCEECGQSFAKKKPFLKHVEKYHSNHYFKTITKKQEAHQSQENQPVNQKANGPNNSKKKRIRKGKEQRQNNSITNRIDVDEDVEQSSQINQKDQEFSQDFKQASNTDKKEQKPKIEKNTQALLFRCIHTNCVSAFPRIHQLFRHLKQTHKQSHSLDHDHS